ncbi:MAG: hypothetical protein M1831_000602 [Alyxoria varia]|nr:MAG: hypothetical protein M1831_000602 [Alyxoria varia]
MQFKASIVGAAAFALSVAAQSSNVLFTKTPDSVSAGESVDIGYKVANPSQPATILLRRGDSNNLQTVSVLTSSTTGGSYTWTPSESLANGDDYALEIKQGSEINYSGQFPLSGGSATGKKSPPSYSKPSGPAEVTSAPSYKKAPSASPSAVPGCAASKIGDNQVQYPAECSSFATSAKSTPVPSTPSAPVKETPAPYSPPKKSAYNYPGSSAHGPAKTYAPVAPQPPVSTPKYNPPPKASAPVTGGEAPAGTSSGAQATSTGGASTIGSSLALIMGAFAAVAFIN